MVIDDLDIFRSRHRLSEADAVLVVDADAVLAGASALERFEPVAGRNPQIVQLVSGFDEQKFAVRHPLQVVTELCHSFAFEDLSRRPVSGRTNHTFIKTLGVMIVKRYEAAYPCAGYEISAPSFLPML